MAKFQPGQSGNPEGRPKKEVSIRWCLKSGMSKDVVIPGKNGEPDKTITRGEFLSEKLFQLAASGDLSAIKLCLDQIDGPPVQTVENIMISHAPVDPAAALAAAKQAEEAGEV